MSLYLFPTDTVFGVGAPLGSAEDIARLYELKERPRKQPIAVLIGGMEQLEQMVDPAVLVTLNSWLFDFWPGALTLALPTRKDSPYIDTMPLVNQRGTISVRLPDHKVARDLMKKIGQPLVTSSANFRGEPPPSTEEQIDVRLREMVEEFYPGQTKGYPPSTVLDMTMQPAQIVREGPITREMLSQKIPIE